ncbi:MAG TPA: hypothetical protein VMF64_11905 [Steroidobacteraceae bacterium]|nr:hypothetical protein [Steroidobacteraceae bacterium]
MNARRPRQVLIILTLLAYALLEQYSNTAHAPPALGALLAVSPLLLALGLLAMRTARPAWALMGLAAAATLLLVLLWPPLTQHYARLYLVQQCGLFLTFAAVFGRTLLPGYTPLCTQWALRVHGALDGAALRYTRGVTWVWMLFFIAAAVGSLALYVSVERSLWSAFGNFAVLPLAAVLFAIEYRLRRHRLPTMPRATLGQMLAAYLAEPRGTRRP